jgi:hypothetical protein
MVDFEGDFRRTELGLWVPDADPMPSGADVPPELRNCGTYLTYSDVLALHGGEGEMTEADLTQRLSRLSAADCLNFLGFLSARLGSSGGPRHVAELQRELIGEVFGSDSDFARLLSAQLDRAEPTVVFCEQQLVHLARLAVLHADSRPADDFADGKLYEEWLDCLLGVTDLLDLGLEIEDPDERISWELRQCGLNHRDDLLPTIALHHEVYRVLMPEMNPAAAEGVEAAFAAHTGMSLADFSMIGAAAQARFTRDPGALLRPAEYLASTELTEAQWLPFFGLLARDQAALAAELAAEEARYGPTTYGSLSFDRFPLFEREPGVFSLISLPSLSRRTNAGVYHLLAEAAEAEGVERTTHTRSFGLPFQRSVERALRRGVEASGTPIPIAADVRYGASAARMRDSSDVILGYEGNPVFVEVVSGPLRAGTLTRGDREHFEADLERLVIGKAGQLQTSIEDFLSGELELAGFDPETSRRIWPVIVSTYEFPLRQEIARRIEDRLAETSRLQGDRIAPLALISAEELFFCEGMMERGASFLSLISGWKSDPVAASQSLKNHLIERAGGRAPGSAHFDLVAAEAFAEQGQRLFGSDKGPAEILASMREGSARDRIAWLLDPGRDDSTRNFEGPV